MLSSRMSFALRTRTCTPRRPARRAHPRPRRSLGDERFVRVPTPPESRLAKTRAVLCALCVKYLSSSVFLRESPRSRPLCVVLSSFPSSPRLSPTKLHRYNSTDMHFCARKCASNHRVFNRVQSHGQLTENKHDQNVYFHTNAHSFRANLLL